MGCCSSREQSEHAVVVPRNVSTTEKFIVAEQPLLEGCKVSCYTAACPASYPYTALTRVVQGDGHLFAALFDGIGGAHAAQHCTAHCHELLQQALDHGTAPDTALREMLLQLDASFFASALSDEVKANVGATGVALLINMRSRQCIVARLGDSRPFLGRSKGAFSQATVEVQLLGSQASYTSSLPALVASQQVAAPSTPQHHHSSQRDQGSPSWQTYLLPNEFAPATSVVHTRCIGLGIGKDRRLAAKRDLRILGAGPLPAIPFISAVPEITTHQLCPGDDALVLSNEGLLDVVSPEEAALLVQHFNPTRLRALQQAYLQGAADSVPSERQAAADQWGTTLGVQRRPVNIASVVAHHAMTKALLAHNRLYHHHLDYGSLQALDLRVDVEALRPPPGAKGSTALLTLPPGMDNCGMCKCDVYADMSMLVIAIEWPGSAGALPDLPSRLPRGVPEVTRMARYHWQLVRQAAKFHIARRRQLLRSWHAVVDGSWRQAQQLARQTEVAAWRLLGQAVQVSASGDVVEEGDQTGLDQTPTKQPRTPLSGRLSGGKGTPVRPPSSFSTSSAAATPTKSSSPAKRPGTAGSRTPVAAGLGASSMATSPSNRNLSLRSARRPMQ